MATVSPMERWSDRIHPVIVRELRQTVRSGGVVSMMTAGGLLASGVMIFAMGRFGAAATTGRGMGREVFVALSVMMFLIALVVSLTQTGNRMRAEREPGGIDLLYTTPLKPGGIVLAKIFCGLHEAILFMSVGLPMLYLTTFLRGIDVVTVLWSQLLAVPLLAGALVVTLFIGALRCGRFAKGLVSLVALGVLVPVSLAMYAAVVVTLAMNGVGAVVGMVTHGAGPGVLMICLMVLLVLFAGTIALVSRAGSGPVVACEEETNRHF
jgi:MFS family permease